MLPFQLYLKETGNLLTSEKYINFLWNNPDCKILFSVTKRGNAAVCHFTSDKAGLRKLKQALNEWCTFCFWLLPWCEMIIGIIERPSVCRLAERCNFKQVASFGKNKIYIRRP
jgi:hypothetical protein